MADTQCGPYRLTAGNDGFMHINGVKPENQKMSFLKAKEDYQNLKMEWTVATNQPGRWVGLDTSSATAKPFSTHSGCKPVWIRHASMQHTTAEK